MNDCGLHDDVDVDVAENDNNTKYQFTETTNPTTGKREWVAEMQDEHDYFTDIARSSYADMLHDHERNKLYHEAIRLAVKCMHEQGRQAKVLDIGTGTGLLSMMAANAGAEVITAVEVFSPMANVAKEVTKLNGFSRIRVINKHSTNVTVGENCDMQEKANILVTELFDTELIGEGALAAYKHAHQYLMEEDCLAVPHRAIIKAVVVQSELMWSWNELREITVDCKDGKTVQIMPDPQIVDGCGITAVHDIQLSEFPTERLKELTEPFEVFDFNWADKSISDGTSSKRIHLKAINDGMTHVVLSWWDLDMDKDGKILLSTAPKWHHPTPSNMQWRDHWIQSVYFLPKKFHCSKGKAVTVQVTHDAYSLQFQASDGDEFDNFPACDYPPRMLWSRPRLGKINDEELNKKYVSALNRAAEKLPKNGVALCASDFSLLPLFAAQVFPGREVVAMEQSKLAQRGLHNLALSNHLSIEVLCGDLSTLKSDLNGRKVSLLIGEPHFTSSILPWHDLYFWYIRSEIASIDTDSVIMPCRARLCAAGVWFKDLWKIRAPVGKVEGFDVSPMDNMIDEALNKKEYFEPEPHPLWEYPNHVLTQPCNIMTYDFTKLVPQENISSKGDMNFLKNVKSICHGVALWMEYDLDEYNTVSTGLMTPHDFDLPLEEPRWSMHHKQAVFLFKHPIKILTDSLLNYDVTFLPSTGDVKMKFKIT